MTTEQKVALVEAVWETHGLNRALTKVGKGLKKAEWDFAKKRRLLDTLEVQVYLSVKDGVKKLHLECILGENVLSLLTRTKSG